MTSYVCLQLSHSIFHRSAHSLLSKSSSIFHFHRCYASTDSRQLRSTDLVALEYADLNLPYKDSGVPAQVPDWNEVYKDPTLPLMADIGCGSGRFLLWLARRNCDSGNYLGLEIRQKLVKCAELWMKELALTNIHFIHANASVSFKQLCPDPHFEKRHHKHLVVQKPLVDSIVKYLMHGGKGYVIIDGFKLSQYVGQL